MLTNTIKKSLLLSLFTASSLLLSTSSFAGPKVESNIIFPTGGDDIDCKIANKLLCDLDDPTCAHLSEPNKLVIVEMTRYQCESKGGTVIEYVTQ